MNGATTSSDSRSIEPAPFHLAGVVGFLYLFQMATAVFGQSFVRDHLIVRGDPAKTAQNIIGSEKLFRLSIAGDLVTYTTLIVLIWGLYVLLRSTNRNLALLAVLFRLAENAILCVATVNSLVVLRLLSPTNSVIIPDPAERSALAALAMSRQGLGMNVAFVLLGVGSTIFSYLWWKSGYIPRWLAGLGIIGSLLLAAITLAAIVFPTLNSLGLIYMMPLGLYEVGLGLWLLVKGINPPLSFPLPDPAHSLSR